MNIPWFGRSKDKFRFIFPNAHGLQTKIQKAIESIVLYRFLRPYEFVRRLPFAYQMFSNRIFSLFLQIFLCAVHDLLYIFFSEQRDMTEPLIYFP